MPGHYSFRARFAVVATTLACLFASVAARADAPSTQPADGELIRPKAQMIGYGAEQARLGARIGGTLHPALVNGAAGVVVMARGRPVVVMGFTVAAGQIVEIDAIADPRRVRRVAAAVLDDEGTGPDLTG